MRDDDRRRGRVMSPLQHDDRNAADRRIARSKPPGLRAHLAALAAEEAPLMAADEASAVVADLVAEVGGLGPLEPFLVDPTVTEVMVNAGTSVWVERHGAIEHVGTTTVRHTLATLEHIRIAQLDVRGERLGAHLAIEDVSGDSAIVETIAADAGR